MGETVFPMMIAIYDFSWKVENWKLISCEKGVVWRRLRYPAPTKENSCPFHKCVVVASTDKPNPRVIKHGLSIFPALNSKPLFSSWIFQLAMVDFGGEIQSTPIPVYSCCQKIANQFQINPIQLIPFPSFSHLQSFGCPFRFTGAERAGSPPGAALPQPDGSGRCARCARCAAHGDGPLALAVREPLGRKKYGWFI